MRSGGNSDSVFLLMLLKKVKANDNAIPIKTIVKEMPLNCSKELTSLWNMNVSVSLFINSLEDKELYKEDSEEQKLILQIWDALKTDKERGYVPGYVNDSSIYFSIEDSVKTDDKVLNDLSFLNILLAKVKDKPSVANVPVNKVITSEPLDCSEFLLDKWFDSNVTVSKLIIVLQEQYKENKEIQVVIEKIKGAMKNDNNDLGSVVKVHEVTEKNILILHENDHPNYKFLFDLFEKMGEGLSDRPINQITKEPVECSDSIRGLWSNGSNVSECLDILRATHHDDQRIQDLIKEISKRIVVPSHKKQNTNPFGDPAMYKSDETSKTNQDYWHGTSIDNKETYRMPYEVLEYKVAELHKGYRAKLACAFGAAVVLEVFLFRGLRALLFSVNPIDGSYGVGANLFAFTVSIASVVMTLNYVVEQIKEERDYQEKCLYGL